MRLRALVLVATLACSCSDNGDGGGGGGGGSGGQGGSPTPCGEPLLLAPNANSAVGITSDGENVYAAYPTADGSEIAAMPLSGGASAKVIVSAPKITALAADASGLYYLTRVADSQLPYEVHRWEPSTGEDTLLAEVYGEASSLALDETDVYVVAMPGELWRTPKNGMQSNVEKVAAESGKVIPSRLVVGGSTALWVAESQLNEQDGRLRFAGVPGPSTIGFVGPDTHYIDGIAWSGDQGFAFASPFNDNLVSTDVWSFKLGETTPTTIRTVTTGITGLLADSGALYWLVIDGGVQRASLDGSSVATISQCRGFYLAQTDTKLLVGTVEGGVRVFVVPK